LRKIKIYKKLKILLDYKNFPTIFNVTMKRFINSSIVCLLIGTFTSFVNGSNPNSGTRPNASSGDTLRPGVYSANSENEACKYLQQAYNTYKSIGDLNKPLTLFLDIDGTLIKECDDIDSYEKSNGNPGYVDLITQNLALKLYRLSQYINIVGLTSVNFLNLNTDGAWPLTKRSLVINENPTLGTSNVEIRAKAMKKALGFFKSSNDEKKTLPFIVERNSGYDIQEQGYDIQEQDSTTIGTKKSNRDGIQFLLQARGQNPQNPQNSKKVLIYSVYYEGIVFVGATNDYRKLVGEGNGFPEKGSAMHAFLSTLPKEELPSFIIGIDDKKENLIGMEETCQLLGLPFYGIHLNFTK
jgi:hypothetical protein